MNDKFSFIIHPMGPRDLLKHPLLRWLPIKNRFFLKTIEYLFGKFNGIKYGEIQNITSAYNNKTISGDIYTLLNTPSNMLMQKTQKMYQKILHLSSIAQKQNSKIIGLGAYTKIIGDAGVTLSKRSPIPITTGNSLSAAATMWAANFAVCAMGFVPKQDKQYLGQVMVIGATGSIGKVVSKLLARNWKKLIITSRSKMRLEKVKNEIQLINPNCEIIIADNPDQYSSTSDLIITATSAKGENIMDIAEVRPGCVICDVSRPFDITKKEAFTRPDILVIASGEVVLPGKVNINCDLNLPNNTVYACLAETALLALEGRYESFTVGREIEYEKVQEIDKMARKHGIRLAAIMGHDMEITEEEIALCKEHALKKRELPRT